jgi:7,8-dihydropterin-6-yl-methyl-4-(beta-D-ribofuranosyl)aminobenzene 5'-phosphate synthase
MSVTTDSENQSIGGAGEASPADSMSGTTITIVVDNHVENGLMEEHGLSLWIATGDRTILFDTGQGKALQPNARSLDVDLRKTDTLVLSHGHYDHTGGIAAVLKLATKADVYCHAGVVQPRYSIRDGRARAIHMPRVSMAAVDELSEERLHWIQEPVMLSNTVGITGPVPRETDFEDSGGPFYLDPGGRRVDMIDDDLALWIQTGEGLVVCVGCCHAGLVNTLRYVTALTGGTTIRAVIGGFHLVNADRRRLDETVRALKVIDPAMIVPCHCTGDEATEFLRRELGGRVHPGAAGMTFRF